jgi:hypothetical protein
MKGKLLNMATLQTFKSKIKSFETESLKRGLKVTYRRIKQLKQEAYAAEKELMLRKARFKKGELVWANLVGAQTLCVVKRTQVFPENGLTFYGVLKCSPDGKPFYPDHRLEVRQTRIKPYRKPKTKK